MQRILALLACLICAGLLLRAPPATAASCSLSIERLDFGETDSLSSIPGDTASSVGIECAQVSASVVTACIHLGPGTGGAGGGVRHMTAGSQTLDFQLYKDSGRSISWGSSDTPGLGSPQKVTFAASGESASTTLTLYGRVFGGQTAAAAGRYSSSFSGVDASFSAVEGPDLNCQTAGGAGSGQAAFEVAATIPANCLVEASDIEFGQHGIIDRNIDAAGTIGVTCTPGTAYAVTLGGGLSAAGNPEARLLQSGSDRAVYGLYRDSARSLPWGSSIETRLPGTGAGTRQSAIVYGRVPPQTLKPGTYSDTVAVTITYGDGP